MSNYLECMKLCSILKSKKCTNSQDEISNLNALVTSNQGKKERESEWSYFDYRRIGDEIHNLVTWHKCKELQLCLDILLPEAEHFEKQTNEVRINELKTFLESRYQGEGSSPDDRFYKELAMVMRDHEKIEYYIGLDLRQYLFSKRTGIVLTDKRYIYFDAAVKNHFAQLRYDAIINAKYDWTSSLIKLTDGLDQTYSIPMDPKWEEAKFLQQKVIGATVEGENETEKNIQLMRNSQADLTMRKAAVAALGELKDSSVVPALSKALKEKKLAAEIYKALFNIGTDEALASIVKAVCLMEGEWIEANKYFTKIETESLCKILIKQLDDDDLMIRKRSIGFIMHHKCNGAINKLIEFLDDTDEEIKFGAASTLGKIGNQEALETLKEKQESGDKHFNKQIRKSIKKLEKNL